MDGSAATSYDEANEIEENPYKNAGKNGLYVEGQVAALLNDLLDGPSASDSTFGVDDDDVTIVGRYWRTLSHIVVFLIRTRTGSITPISLSTVWKTACSQETLRQP